MFCVSLLRLKIRNVLAPDFPPLRATGENPAFKARGFVYIIFGLEPNSPVWPVPHPVQAQP